ncbi:MAG: hypothetical protein D6780_07270, partial [Candidatus Dadabacteria bacterium]
MNNFQAEYKKLSENHSDKLLFKVQVNEEQRYYLRYKVFFQRVLKYRAALVDELGLSGKDAVLLLGITAADSLLLLHGALAAGITVILAPFNTPDTVLQRLISLFNVKALV